MGLKKRRGAGRSFDLPIWSCYRSYKGGDSLNDRLINSKQLPIGFFALMKALLAVLGTSFAVNVMQTNLQIACHEKNKSESARFIRILFDIPCFHRPVCMYEKGKICRILRMLLTNMVYFQLVTLIHRNREFDNIVEMDRPMIRMTGTFLTFLP